MSFAEEPKLVFSSIKSEDIPYIDLRAYDEEGKLDLQKSKDLHDEDKARRDKRRIERKGLRPHKCTPPEQPFNRQTKCALERKIAKGAHVCEQ